ncbi:hypothetical protein BHE74_00025708, partial [Ensete ventricosum]
ARHGTRAPTKKRIKELDRLAIRLDSLLNDAKQKTGKDSLQKIPAWLWGWQSPWKGRERGGELIIKGEEELYKLGIRVRERFPQLFDEEYHPDTFRIMATQVPRASASAVAFGMGIFAGKGTLGPGQHRSFSVISESRASDIHLRFFDTCETYKLTRVIITFQEFRTSKEPDVEKMKEPLFDQIASLLSSRYLLNFTRQDISSLWFLCKQVSCVSTMWSAGLFFSLCWLELSAICRKHLYWTLQIKLVAFLILLRYVSLLEWTDDIEAFVLKGYGESVNYRMGVPLLQDVVLSMEQAISAEEGNLNFLPYSYTNISLYLKACLHSASNY